MVRAVKASRHGQVFNLEKDIVGAVIFGDYLKVKEGATVRSTGQLLSVPVGEGLLGRVVDPLGYHLMVRGRSKPRKHGKSTSLPQESPSGSQ